MLRLVALALLSGAASALTRVAPRASIAVFGSTGLTGRECTHQLLERGVAVRALCRTPANVLTPLGSTGKEEAVTSDKLFKFKGSVDVAADVEKVFESGDIEGVIIALGGKTKDVGPTMLTDGSAIIIDAMKKYDEADAAYQAGLAVAPGDAAGHLNVYQAEFYMVPAHDLFNNHHKRTLSHGPIDLERP